MIDIRDADSGKVLGEITEAQLQFLEDQMEEEDTTDQDYYISQDTIDMFEVDGADAGLLAFLRRALGGRRDMDIRWDRE
jgi:hypothetical protein